MAFISKFILPKQVDFDQALQLQAEQAARLVHETTAALVAGDRAALDAVYSNSDEARALKTRNMKELLAVYITPYDKESIFRLITQLDWVGLSAHHLVLLAIAYDIDSLRSAKDVLLELDRMATLLNQGVSRLSAGKLEPIADNCDRIHDKYDQVVSLCARLLAVQLQKQNLRQTIPLRDLLAQLREIAKRIHVAANTLEDMMIKVS